MSNIKGIAIGAVAAAAIILVTALSLLQSQPAALDDTSTDISEGLSIESAMDASFVTEGINIQDSMTAALNYSLQSISCFQRTDEIVEVDENGWYAVVIYDEIEFELCDQDNVSQYGAPMRLDISSAGPDYLEEIEPSYTEYRLLNGTLLTFGEKRINYSDS